jgi:hypothetical protein
MANPSIFSVGQVLTAADMNTYTNNEAVGVQRTTDLSIANSSFTAVTWSSAMFDTDAIWSSGAPTRLTCKTAGIYVVTANVVWQASFNGERIGYFRVNNTDPNYSYVRQTSNSASGVSTMVFTAHIKLAVNDYVELIIWQSSGGALNALSAAGTRTFAGMSRVSA